MIEINPYLHSIVTAGKGSSSLKKKKKPFWKKPWFIDVYNILALASQKNPVRFKYEMRG